MAGSTLDDMTPAGKVELREDCVSRATVFRLASPDSRNGFLDTGRLVVLTAELLAAGKDGLKGEGSLYSE